MCRLFVLIIHSELYTWSLLVVVRDLACQLVVTARSGVNFVLSDICCIPLLWPMLEAVVGCSR